LNGVFQGSGDYSTNVVIGRKKRSEKEEDVKAKVDTKMVDKKQEAEPALKKYVSFLKS